MSDLSRVSKKSRAWKLAGFYLLIALVVLFLCWPTSPAVRHLPRRDSGVFLYIGDQITKGEIPYRDLWDHKGPLIYYIDAIGLTIGGGSRWGVWFLEWLVIFSAAVFGQLSLQKSFSRTAATFATFTWLITLALVLSGGNLTEEYALVLQFAAIYFFVKRNDSLIYSFLIGITAALSFLLRPNMVGIWLSVVLVVLILGFLNKTWHRVSRSLSLMLLGFGSILGVTLFFFWVNDALPQFLSAVFQFNFAYSAQITLTERSNVLFKGLEFLNGTAIVAIAAWFVALFYLVSQQRSRLLKPDLILLALIAFIIEIMLLLTSGRDYRHYFMMLLPIIAVLLAFFAHELEINAGSKELLFIRYKTKIVHIWLAALFLALSIEPAKQVWDILLWSTGASAQSNELLSQLERYTPGEDNTMLFWGSESSFNFLLARQSPTRFFYQTPLLMLDYATEEMTNEFISDIQQRRPIIIDTSATYSHIPPLNKAQREDWERRVNYPLEGSEIGRAIQFIESQYEEVGKIDSQDWIVYEYRD